MKLLETVVASAIMSMSILSTAYAATAPAACPQIPLIQKAGLSYKEYDAKSNMYVIAQVNRYNTPSTWAFAFVLKGDEATSKQDAFNKAKTALATLSGTPDPLPVDEQKQNQWYCWYDNTYNYMSVAITPLNPSVNNFASFMKK